tara:strand:- start:67 stop:438 length:372 start_codon:yes stop_codon:yes gene_type:complete
MSNTPHNDTRISEDSQQEQPGGEASPEVTCPPTRSPFLHNLPWDGSPESLQGEKYMAISAQEQPEAGTTPQAERGEQAPEGGTPEFTPDPCNEMVADLGELDAPNVPAAHAANGAAKGAGRGA